MRYVGWYSNRVRSKRAAALAPSPVAQEREVAQEIAARARSTWARLIQKVYEVDPLECPRCKAPMRVIALIGEADVIQRILKHLGLWAPPQWAAQNERAPPAVKAGVEAPIHADNVLTYHPVPAIA